MNAIMGWTHLLKAGRLDDSQRTRALESIDRAARSQAQLIEDLLDVSRIVSGKLHIAMQPVELEAIIEAALESQRPAADAKGVHLRAHRPGCRLRPRRCRTSAAGRAEPAVERRQVHARRRSDRRDGRAITPRRGDDFRARYRGGHQPRVPAIRLRPLPPGGRHQHAHAHGPRPGSRDRAARGRAARRVGAGAQWRARPGRDVHGHVADRRQRRRAQGQGASGGRVFGLRLGQWNRRAGARRRGRSRDARDALGHSRKDGLLAPRGRGGQGCARVAR